MFCMKPKCIHTLLCIILVSCCSMYAEDHNLHTDPRLQITSPSTEAQSLSKFAEVPVDLYTGRTAINIPLFTISCNDIVLPISLSYHGGGTKVGDVGGVLGTGWTLNAGGVVSRIVRGIPDEFYLHNGFVKGYDRLNSNEKAFITKLLQRDIPADSSAVFDDQDAILQEMTLYGQSYDENKIDLSPDNYIFSVDGFSGVFAGSNPNNIQTTGGCKISKVGGIYYLTGVNGLKYEFAYPEQKIFPYRMGDIYNTTNWDDLPEYQDKYTSAWWLTSISSVAGDSLKLKYSDSIEKQLSTPHSSYAYTQYDTFDENIERKTIHRFYNGYSNPFIKTSSDTLYHRFLEEIIAPNCTLRFYYSPKYNGYSRLDSISLYSSATNAKESPIERYEFVYVGTATSVNLSMIKHRGKNGKYQYYNFSYHYTNTGGMTSENKDHWGYFSKESIGRFADKKYFGIDPIGLSAVSTSERHADNANAINNTLKSITYPSGLTVEFTWEPHDFSKLSTVGENAYQQYKEYDYSETPTPIYQTITKSTFELCGKENQEVKSKSIGLTNEQYINIDISKYFYSSDVWSCIDCVMDWSGDYIATDLPEFSILFNGTKIFRTNLDSVSIRRLGNQGMKQIPVKQYGAGSYTFQLTNPRTTLMPASSSVSNMPCSYYHEMFNKPETSLGKIYVSITEQYPIENTFNTRNVGGVRIKRITYKDVNQQLMIKEYAYKDSNNVSTGILAYAPRYASKHLMYVPGCGANIITDLLVLRSNGLPYVLNGHGHIEYQQVSEYTVSQQGEVAGQYSPINRVDYYYSTSISPDCSDVDDTGYNTYIPTDLLQLTSRKHKRGHLLRKIEYADEMKVTNYEYQVVEDTNKHLFSGNLFPTADFQGVNYNYGVRPYKNFSVVKYRVIPYNKRLMSQSTSGQITNTYHAYTYATNSYSSALNADMPLTHTFVTSEGNTLVEHFTYLPNTNKVEQYIKTKDGYVLDGYQLKYDNAYRVLQRKRVQISPPALLSSITNDSWVILDSCQYDTITNKLIEVCNCQTNITTTYLWAYGGQYPVAEITNANYNEVTDKLEELNLSIADLRATCNSDSISILDELRNLLPSASINTMTYEPLVGITSYTDAKGYTQYYEYDDFGHVQEIYELVNGTKHILKHFDYQLKNQ